ncbi:MAG: hypothetical protein AMXMBFR53_06920 [Gemmatimonadota bacterium]
MSEAAPRSPEALTLERLRQVVDVLEEGVAILGADGVVEFINASGEEILGVPAGQLLGWKLLDFRWEIVDENGAPLRREDLPPLKVLRTGVPEGPIIVGMTSPAVEEMRWVEVSARPLQAEREAQPHGAVSSFRDVSPRLTATRALRASEARYQSVVESVPAGIFHLAPDGSCVWVNDAWSRIFGLPAEAGLGFGWMDGIHPDDLDAVKERWATAEATGDPYLLEHRVVRPDGEVRWVVCRSAEQRDALGRSEGYIGSVTDITETKEAGLIKDQLIGLVSHELRSPLLAIVGGLTFLEPYVDDADEDGRRLYEIALRNARLLERMVRDLLDIERLRAGQLQLELGDVDLASLLGEARDVMLPLAEERGVSVETTVADGVTARADRDRLLQVLTNLLSNAVKFSDPGSRVTVEATRADRQIVFLVRDTGRGIPAEYHERIFERFGQVDAADAAERGGAGLGLAISRAIVLGHRGRIWVESAPGEGASFYFTLPV